MKKVYSIKDSSGVRQPAYTHADGTVVSRWTGLPELLIRDSEGTRYISHELAMELGYEA